MTIMEQFANPETIHSISFGDQMIGSLITMIMGIGDHFYSADYYLANLLQSWGRVWRKPIRKRS